MAISDRKSPSDNKGWGFFKVPFLLSGNNSNATSSSPHQNQSNPQVEGPKPLGSNSVSSVPRSLLPKWRRLKVDPANKLYFPCAILAPGESLIATVFKFLEHPENNEKPMHQKSRDKFKIISMKVKGDMDYVPELFDEQKDQPVTEQILQVVFLNPEHPDPALEKLKCQLADADAAAAAHKKPPEDAGPRLVGEGLVIDEWKERRERYLAQQQVGVDSV